MNATPAGLFPHRNRRHHRSVGRFDHRNSVGEHIRDVGLCPIRVDCDPIGASKFRDVDVLPVWGDGYSKWAAHWDRGHHRVGGRGDHRDTPGEAYPAEAAPFLYVTNTGDDTVSVIDTATNTVVGLPIPVGVSPTGVAVTPDGTKVYVTNSNVADNTVSVIKTATNTVVKTVPAGRGPVAVAVTPDGTKVYVVNNASKNVSIFHRPGFTLVATIPVGNFPQGVAITPDGTQAYVTNSIDATVSVINTATNTVAGLPIPVGTAAKASPIASTMANRAINPRAHELLLCIMPISSHYGAASSVAGRVTYSIISVASRNRPAGLQGGKDSWLPATPSARRGRHCVKNTKSRYLS